jgi:thioredoxin reductase (NADPH)
MRAALKLYSRPGCQLCDELATELMPLIEGFAALEIINIDEDMELKKRYGLRIPVLVGGEQELSAFPLDVTAVRKYMASDHG